MSDRVEWFEHGCMIIAELTAEGALEFWERDGYEIQWFRCPPNRLLVGKANRKFTAKRRKVAQRGSSRD